MISSIKYKPITPSSPAATSNGFPHTEQTFLSKCLVGIPCGS